MVQSLKGPTNDRPREVLWDKRLRGFGLRITNTGHKTWIAVYRRGGRNGRLQELKIGTYPPLSLAEAREKARGTLAAAQLGDDPVEEKREERDAETFAALAERYLVEHARRWKKPRSVEEDKRNLKNDVLPIWGNRRVNEITRRDVIALVDGIVNRGAPIHANRVLALISKMFNFAIDKDPDRVENNPAYKVKKPSPESSRDRVLSSDEIRNVWGALESEPPNIRAIFKLLLLTGERPGEIKGMRWTELDISRVESWWTIPGGRDGRTKNKKVHRVPLVGEAHRILQSLSGDGPMVFPNRSGEKPFTGLQKALNRLRKNSGVNFQTRDLRRTLATGLGELGIDRIVIQKVLNHSDGSVTGIYDRHTYDTQKRGALERWDRRLCQILTGEAAEAPKVVRLPT
jgi:integrase